MLHFGSEQTPTGSYSAEPRFIRKIAKDDFEAVAMSASTVAKDISDLRGLRGYPCGERMAQKAMESLSNNDVDAEIGRSDDAEVHAATLWRRGRFEHADGVPIPWLWPVRKVLKALRKRALSGVAASVRALVEGGWPTQFKLFCHGCAAHSMCACARAVGTLRHKLGACPLNSGVRAEYCPVWLQKVHEKECWHPLFSRGVPIRPKSAVAPREVSWLVTAGASDAGSQIVDLYSDGSAKGCHWRAMRGGWSVVALDSAARHAWTRRGTLGGVNISSHRAELRALLAALSWATPPVRIHVDNKDVVDGVSNGRDQCVSSKTADADLWRLVWDKLEDVKLAGKVRVVKVKAHTGWHDLLNRKISPVNQYGNWLADEAAKEATKQSALQAPTASFSAEVKKAVEWMRWVARAAADWQQDTDPEEKLSGAEKLSHLRGPWEYGDPHMQHEIWAVGQRVICRRCGLNQPNPQRADSSVTLRCAGTAAARAAAQSTGNLNFVWALGAYTRAQLVRSGGRLIRARRPPRWMVDLSSLREVARDNNHYAELRQSVIGPLEGQQGEELLVPPWLQAPSWMPNHLVQSWELPEEALRRLVGCERAPLEHRRSGHRVAVVSSMAYCTRCACFAQHRVGSRFKGVCAIPAGRAAAAVSYRLARLRSGRHPITGAPLDA